MTRSPETPEMFEGCISTGKDVAEGFATFTADEEEEGVSNTIRAIGSWSNIVIVGKRRTTSLCNVNMKRKDA